MHQVMLLHTHECIMHRRSYTSHSAPQLWLLAAAVPTWHARAHAMHSCASLWQHAWQGGRARCQQPHTRVVSPRTVSLSCSAYDATSKDQLRKGTCTRRRPSRPALGQLPLLL